MLKQLYIKNFTLIDELNISLYPGFSVITGETGAGKSIILGAIGLLLGNRADSKAIKAGRERPESLYLQGADTGQSPCLQFGIHLHLI